MFVIHSELYTSIILASIVTLLVWFNTPRLEMNEADKFITIKLILRTFVVSLVLIYVIYYFTNNSHGESNDVMANIIKGTPDF